MAESCDVTVLTAAAIRPDYRPGGESFRHIVISAGKVAALTRTAADAARAAGPGAAWVDLGPACVGPGFIDTHIHTLQAAADITAASACARPATLGDAAGGGARGGAAPRGGHLDRVRAQLA